MKRYTLAGLTILGAAIVSATPTQEESATAAPANAAAAAAAPQAAAKEEPADPMLDCAIRTDGLGGLMFGAHAVSKIHPHTELVVTSARDAEGRPTKLFIKSGTVRVFRADASLDDFTAKGGWYWYSRDAQGQTAFEPRPGDDGLSDTPPKAGPLVLVIYHPDGTIDWYSLHYDMRC